MTVDHIVGNNQVLKLNHGNMSKISNDLIGGKSVESGEENNGGARTEEEVNGDLKSEGNGKLKIALRDCEAPRESEGGSKSQDSDEEERQQEDSDGEDKLKCGLGGVLSPKWMQVFASKQAFLVTFCITWILQGMYYTYFVSTITTIEKLFHIQSKTTGIIMSATEIGQISSSLLLTYYGGQGHRPKWIGWGMVLFAMSSFMCALPHFMFGEQLIHANNILYSGLSTNPDFDSNPLTSPNLCRSLFTDNYPPPMLIKDHLNFLKENPNFNIRNSFLILHSESQTSHNLPSVIYNNSLLSERNLDAGASSNNNKNNNDNNNNNNNNDDDDDDDDNNNNNNNNNKNKRVNGIGGDNDNAYVSLSKFYGEGENNSSYYSRYPDLPGFKAESYADAECEEELLQEQRIHSKITNAVLTIFFISLLGVGMGQTAVYTLGIPYIDDNVAAKESPLYFAITIGVRIIGPAMGFILGSVCTRLYHDLSVDPQITPNDPRWVGAWWLGLVLVGALLMLASLAMFAFPKRLKSYKGRLSPTSFVRKSENPSLKDFPKAVKRLLKNDILMFRTASSVLHILPIAGLYTFLPKYLESQFRLAAHAANMISGVGGILVMGVGIIISGVFILRFKPNARFVAAWIAFTAVLYALGMGILMLIGCPMDDFAGLTSDRVGQSEFQPACNTTCNCNKDKFSPVCGVDGRTYFSACHAGCRNATFRDGKIVEFSDCLCIDMNDTISPPLSSFQIPVSTANIGFCDLNCSNFVPYILLFSMFVFIHSTSEVGSMLLILRCVDPSDKAMALGLIQFAIGLFGNVPCPIVYGAVVDYACLIWDKACGKQGACWLYDTDVFRMFFHGTTGAILLLAFFVDVVVWYKAGDINFVDDQIPVQSEELSPMKQRSETSV